VIILSVKERISFALASVVVIFSWVNNDVTIFLNIASRWLVFLPSRLPALL
jgi:hypothetical protein